MMFQAEKAKADATSSGSEESDDEDMEKAMAKEISAMKEVQTGKRRFQAVTSGANNCLFIKTTLDNPTELAYSIFEDIYESETCKSRYVMRMMPVAGTCKTQDEKIQNLAFDVLSKFFKEEGHSYSIQVKVRNNNTMGRKQIVAVLGEVIRALNVENSVNLTDPEYVVNVDILRSICCMSVMKDFFKFKKYNLQEVAQGKSASKSKSEAKNSKDSGQVHCEEKEKGDVSAHEDKIQKEDTCKSEKNETCKTEAHIITDVSKKENNVEIEIKTDESLDVTATTNIEQDSNKQK